MLLVAALFIIFVVKAITGIIKYRSKRKAEMKKNNALPKGQELNPVSEYINYDNAFSPSEFKEKLSNLYVQLQNGWQNNDISALRSYFTDNFYVQLDSQLRKFRNNNETNYIERLAVLGVELMGWKRESGTDIMIAHISTRMVDYVKNDRTGAIVRGSNMKEKFVTYECELIRTTGISTKRLKGMVSATCPCCGANVDINQSAVCVYCGSVLRDDTFAWALNNIKSI